VPKGWVTSPENDKLAGEAGYRIVEKNRGVEMVWVPGGEFTMCSDKGGFTDPNRPAHHVEMSGFCIGRTEVPVGQWRSVMGELPAPLREKDYNDQGDDHPVVMVSWRDCYRFSKTIGLELPTDAQWEYAAAGPQVSVYPWGDEWDPAKAQCARDLHGYERTAPAGSIPEGASWCGAMDLAGNVGEWVADWYTPDYMANSPTRDPRGPHKPLKGQEFKIRRGGSFRKTAPRAHQCAAVSSRTVPFATQWWGGFRVALGPLHDQPAAAQP